MKTCARPGCNEQEWRIDGYCSIYCRDLNEARADVLDEVLAEIDRRIRNAGGDAMYKSALASLRFAVERMKGGA